MIKLKPKLTRLFIAYCKRELSKEGEGVEISAAGFKEFLWGKGDQTLVGFGPSKEHVDFYELSAEVSDKFVIEEGGYDSFYLTEAEHITSNRKNATS